MAKIDEYSVNLGELRGELKSLVKIHTIMNDKLEKVLDWMPVVNEKANKAHSRIDEMLDPENGILTLAAANAMEAQETLKKGKWVLTGVGLSGILGGTYIGGLLSKVGSIFGPTT